MTVDRSPTASKPDTPSSGNGNDVLRDAAIAVALGGALIAALWLLHHKFVAVIWLAVVLPALAAIGFRAQTLRLIALGMAALLLPLALIESALRIVPLFQSGSRYGDHYSGYYLTPHELGYTAHPSRVVHAEKFLEDGAAVYDVHYTIDAHGHREVPGIGEPSSRPAVLFFGGSYTFGEGLEDNQTIPAQMVRASGARWTAANLGFHGYGPHQMLRSLQLGLPHELGLARIERVVYFAVPWLHLDRIAGLRPWDPFGPRYLLDSSGRPRFEGSFLDPESWWDRLAASSRFYWRIRGLFDLSEQEKRELAVALVEESARLIEEDFGAEFSVLVWPDDEGRSAFLAARWSEAGLDVIDASDILPDPWAPEYRIAGDDHPNALAARMIGRALAEYFERGADGAR